MSENTPQTIAPTFNISFHIDTAPLAAALVALVDRLTKEDK